MDQGGAVRINTFVNEILEGKFQRGGKNRKPLVDPLCICHYSSSCIPRARARIDCLLVKRQTEF